MTRDEAVAKVTAALERTGDARSRSRSTIGADITTIEALGLITFDETPEERDLRTQVFKGLQGYLMPVLTWNEHTRKHDIPVTGRLGEDGAREILCLIEEKLELKLSRRQDVPDPSAPAKPNHIYPVGTVVKLRSGGPNMTVISHRPHNGSCVSDWASCEWWERGEKREDLLPEDALMPAHDHAQFVAEVNPAKAQAVYNARFAREAGYVHDEYAELKGKSCPCRMCRPAPQAEATVPRDPSAMKPKAKIEVTVTDAVMEGLMLYQHLKVRDAARELLRYLRNAGFRIKLAS
jgi:uncharacterized protein YodC (DUF2158 family)